jgi:hypothetical protein
MTSLFRRFLSVFGTQKVNPAFENSTKVGEEAGTRIAEEIALWFKIRGDAWSNRLLEILEERLKEIAGETDPALAARAELGDFRRHLDEQIEGLRYEFASDISEWLELAATLEADEAVQYLVRQRFDDLAASTYLRGVEVAGNAVLRLQGRQSP